MATSTAPEDFSDLTREDLARFMFAVGCKTGCPCCSTSRWSTSDPQTHGFSVALNSSKDGEVNASKGIACYIMVCENCGFVRNHAAQTVAAWKRSNDKATDAHS